MNNRYREEEQLEKETLSEESLAAETEEQHPEDVVDAEVIENNEKLEELEAEVKKLKDQYLRTLADTENFRRRIDEERIRERKYGSQRLLEKIVEVIDIFDKAVNVNPDDQKLKNFLIGFDMINNMMKKILEEEGVKKIVALNQKFNPNFHHAVEITNMEDVEEDIIIEEFLSGYMYKDRVLRPTSVKVNKKNKEEIKQ